ncbi:EamA family transporter [Spongorhabdus nitratireducens]
MQNAALYILTVLIWGTTWFAIKLQLNGVAVEASIVYRFTIAATVLFAILLFSRKLQSLSLRTTFSVCYRARVYSASTFISFTVQPSILSVA